MVIQLQTDAGKRSILVHSYGHHPRLLHAGVFIMVCISISCEDCGGMVSIMIETRMKRVSLFPKTAGNINIYSIRTSILLSKMCHMIKYITNQLAQKLEQMYRLLGKIRKTSLRRADGGMEL